MDSDGPKEECVTCGFTLNTTEPSVCGDDAAFLSNYSDHLFIITTITCTLSRKFLVGGICRSITYKLKLSSVQVSTELGSVL